MLEGLSEGNHHLQLFGHSGRADKEATGVKSAGPWAGSMVYTVDSAASMRIFGFQKEVGQGKTAPGNAARFGVGFGMGRS
jgi:hypothetical protein